MALTNLRFSGIAFLRRWWCKKYHQPPHSELFLQYTFLDLLTEFFEDHYEQNRKEMYKMEQELTGAVRLPSHGDSMVEKWEEQLARGEMPDLTEAFPDGMRQKVQEKIKAREGIPSVSAVTADEYLKEFNEKF